MNELISLEYGAAFDGDKVSFDKLVALADKFKAGDAWLRENAAAGKDGFGWMNLPKRNVDDIRSIARWLATRDAIVQIGIGGSALGNLMINNALLPAYWNEQPLAKRNGPRFFMADNVDPSENNAIWDLINPESVAVVVVSKSGSTAETASNFLYFWAKLRDKLGDAAARERIIVITDKEQGILRPFVDEIGCKSLVLPRDVGGRFSVLTCVGLLTGWALGIDCDGLLKGAAEMDELIFNNNDVAANPAFVMAGLNYLHMQAGRGINVLMSYADHLEKFGEWYAQLWGESLGKSGKGSTPVRALGTIDQHSQIQLYTSGPDDKFYSILTVKEGKNDIALPAAPEKAMKQLAYLYGKSMDGLRNAEAAATVAALHKNGRPVVALSIPKIDARRIGGLIYFYEYFTALTGYLLDINPFDQPGVEQGKKYTYGLMGRDNFEADAAEVKTFLAKTREHVIN